jgi:hypothetical protein
MYTSSQPNIALTNFYNLGEEQSSVSRQFASLRTKKVICSLTYGELLSIYLNEPPPPHPDEVDFNKITEERKRQILSLRAERAKVFKLPYQLNLNRNA